MRVTATDEAGNHQTGNCTTIVGNKNVDEDDLFFVIAQVDINGGVEASDDSGSGEPLPTEETIPTEDTDKKKNVPWSDGS